MSAIKRRVKFRIFQFALAIHQEKTAEDLADTLAHHVDNGFSIPRHFA